MNSTSTCTLQQRMYQECIVLPKSVDYTGSIVYNVSRLLADLLAPIVGKTTHNIANSKHLASEMACHMCDDRTR